MLNNNTQGTQSSQWPMKKNCAYPLLLHIKLSREAPKEEQRHPTRYSIIAELCSERCAELKKQGKSTAEIVEECANYMSRLDSEFKKLLEEKTSLTERAIITNEIKLTLAGEETLNQLS